MEKSFGMCFYLKTQRQHHGKEKTVYLRITVNGTSVDISTKRKWETLQWNVAAGRAEGKSDPAKSLNAYLEVLQRKVYECRKTLEEQDEPVTAANIKVVLTGGRIQKCQYLLMEIFQKHNDQMAALVGKEYAPGTLERYITSYKHTLSFLQFRYQVSEINIADLKFEFISEYEFWLKTVRKCDHNTTIKYLSNFKKIVNRCVLNGWLMRDPFAGFKMRKREVDRIAFSEHELQRIAEKDLKFVRLQLVRDIFLFSCYTG